MQLVVMQNYIIKSYLAKLHERKYTKKYSFLLKQYERMFHRKHSYIVLYFETFIKIRIYL